MQLKKCSKCGEKMMFKLYRGINHEVTYFHCANCGKIIDTKSRRIIKRS